MEAVTRVATEVMEVEDPTMQAIGMLPTAARTSMAEGTGLAEGMEAAAMVDTKEGVAMVAAEEEEAMVMEDRVLADMGIDQEDMVEGGRTSIMEGLLGAAELVAAGRAIRIVGANTEEVARVILIARASTVKFLRTPWERSHSK